MFWKRPVAVLIVKLVVSLLKYLSNRTLSEALMFRFNAVPASKRIFPIVWLKNGGVISAGFASVVKELFESLQLLDASQEVTLKK